MEWLIVLLVFAALTLRTVPRNAFIVDGDTIRVRGTAWRITGFDAPEWDQPGGGASTAHLRRIVQGSFGIAFVRGRDAYDRPLATILTCRGPLAWRMAWAGHAHGEGFVARIITRVARMRSVGLWSHDRVISPRLWREGWR